MPDRAAKFVSAIFASVLAGASLVAISPDAAPAADDCLAAPKAETPEGSHWYYRIDHATKRHCWYLRAEGEKLSQAVPPNSSGSAKPVAATAQIPLQPSVADAHAELPAQTSIEPANRNNGLVPALPADPAVSEDGAAGADAQQSVVASRWPDPSAASSTVSPQPATSQAAANAQPEPQSDSPQSIVSIRFSAIRFSGSSAARGCRGSTRRGGFVARLARVAPDAAGRHDRRAGARGHHRKRRSQSRRCAAHGPCEPRQDMAIDRSRQHRAAGSPGRRCRPPPAPLPARPRSSGRAERQGCRIFRPAVEAGPQLDHAPAACYFSSCRCSSRTNVVKPVRRSRFSRSAFRIDCTSANASSIS